MYASVRATVRLTARSSSPPWSRWAQRPRNKRPYDPYGCFVDVGGKQTYWHGCAIYKRHPRFAPEWIKKYPGTSSEARPASSASLALGSTHCPAASIVWDGIRWRMPSSSPANNVSAQAPSQGPVAASGGNNWPGHGCAHAASNDLVDKCASVIGFPPQLQIGVTKRPTPGACCFSICSLGAAMHPGHAPTQRTGRALDIV